MNNLFEPSAAVEILSRVDKLHPTSRAQWGKMDVSQMMAHCRAPFEVYFEDKKIKRGLMSLLFGKIAKRKLFSNKPWPRGLPTAKEFVVIEQKDFDNEKTSLVKMINKFVHEGHTVTKLTHPFFGKMSSQEWGLFYYKHLDHHLHQFGV